MENVLWISLMIGNSRLHWALLQKDNVVEAWDTGHLGREGPPGKVDGKDPGGSIVDEEGIPLSFLSVKAQEMLRGEAVGKMDSGVGASDYLRIDSRRFRVASVVPKELELWVRRCPGIRPISSRDAIDGVGEYATLGVDRALAVRGAARVRGWPVMVVDCGSALTFTAGDEQGRLGGGAILPGVRLQLAALGTRTAQLPSDVVLPDELPPRWAMSTSGAIQAGVMWTIVAGIHGFIKDRWKINPDATVVFTGGDGRALHKAVLDSWEEKETGVERLRDRIQYVGEVIHWGLADLPLEAVER